MKRISHPESPALWIPGLRQELQLDETHDCKIRARNISEIIELIL